MLDLPLWLDELSRLYAFMKPLVGSEAGAVVPDGSEYDLSRLEASDRYRQLLLLEKNTASMKKRLNQKEMESGAFTKRMHNESSELLATIGGLKEISEAKEREKTQLKSEIIRLRGALSKKDSKKDAPCDMSKTSLKSSAAMAVEPLLFANTEIANSGGSTTTAVGTLAAGAFGGVGDVVAERNVLSRSTGTLPTTNAIDRQGGRARRRDEDKVVQQEDPLNRADKNGRPFRVGGVSRQFRSVPQLSRNREWPAPRNLEDLAMSSAYMPSNISRAKAITTVSTATKLQGGVQTAALVNDLSAELRRLKESHDTQAQFVHHLRFALASTLGAESSREVLDEINRVAAGRERSHQK